MCAEQRDAPSDHLRRREHRGRSPSADHHICYLCKRTHMHTHTHTHTHTYIASTKRHHNICQDHFFLPAHLKKKKKKDTAAVGGYFSKMTDPSHVSYLYKALRPACTAQHDSPPHVMLLTAIYFLFPCAFNMCWP